MMKLSLIGGGGRGFSSVNTMKPCCYNFNNYFAANRLFYKPSSRNIHSISCCLEPFPNISNSLAYPLIERYKLEEEAKTVSYTHGKDMMSPCIVEGDIINLSDLLFTRSRDYLIKNNNERVKAEQLAGKDIIIYFTPLSETLNLCTRSLMDVYNDCQLNCSLEIVFVVATDVPNSELNHCSLDSDSQKRFEYIFSCMPWTAIPFSDITSRKRLQRSFGAEVYMYTPAMFVVESTGRVSKLSWKAIDVYGALGLPFSDERVTYLEAEDDAISKHPSLDALLASPQRDYVLSNNGVKVPIHTLEDKVVGLYFYEEGYTGDDSTELLKTAYERLAAEQNFEIVFIYIGDTVQTNMITSEESFMKRFRTMPWLALPFKDPNVKRLKRIFEYPSVQCCDEERPPEFVIFGPHGKFIEPFGIDILARYGTKAYPFTRMAAAKLETEKVKDLKLEMLWDPNTIFKGKDGFQVPFAQLSGKRVILFYERLYEICPDADCWSIKFLRMLKEKYLQVKGTDDEFEVIHVVESTDSVFLDIKKHYIRRVQSKTESFASIHIGELPWLISDETKLLPSFGSCLYFEGYVHSYHSSIFAFDLDGRLVRRSFYPTFEDTDFPFYAGDLEEETLSQLNECFEWNYWNYFEKKGRIYSYKNKHTYDYESRGPCDQKP